MNPFDQLFRQKLEPLAVPPPPQAWSRIEAGLGKKNRGIIWFRWAAVVGILLSLSVMWWYVANPDVNSEVIAKRAPAPVPESVTEEKNEPVLVAAASESASHPKKRRGKNILKQTAAEAPLAPMAEPIAHILPEPAATDKPARAEIGSTAAPVATAIVIEYSLPPIGSPGSEPVKTGQSDFEKIKNTALELKYSDGWWGNLRMAKDDLLALDFKKDKTKRLE